MTPDTITCMGGPDDAERERCKLLIDILNVEVLFRLGELSAADYARAPEQIEEMTK
jgi:hypothetical protein